MDNNQQDATIVQPAAATPVTEQAGSGETPSGAGLSTGAVTNIGINEPKVMTGNTVQSPFTSGDVSMTTGQPFGGPIVTTEIDPNVRREAGPY